MKRRRYAVLMLLLTSAVFELAAETRLDINEVVQLALKNNLGLQRSKATSLAKKRTSDRSWNELIPSTTVSATTSRPTNLVGDTKTASSEWTPSGSVSLSLTLSPSILANLEKARLDYAMGLIDYETARRGLELQTRKAFYQILLYQEQIVLAQQDILTAQSRYDQTKALAKVGQASRLEELSAKVNLESLKPTLESAKADLENALDSFKQVLGLPLDEDIILAGSLGEAEVIESVNDSARSQESADVLSLRTSLALAEASKRAVAHAARLPSLTLAFSPSPTYTNDAWTDTGIFSASLSLKLDSFLPWSSTQESLDQYDDQIGSYRSQLEEALVSSDAVLRSLRRSVENSIASIQALKLNVTLAEETYAQYEEAYQKGGSDLQSLKSAGDDLLEARLKVRQEAYNLLAALLDLENELNLPFGTLGRN